MKTLQALVVLGSACLLLGPAGAAEPAAAGKTALDDYIALHGDPFADGGAEGKPAGG